MIEETIFSGVLRKWCQKVGFLGEKEDFPDVGSRSALRDRQRVAQLFLAKSLEENVTIDNKFMNKVVSQVIGLLSLSQGYA